METQIPMEPSAWEHHRQVFTTTPCIPPVHFIKHSINNQLKHRLLHTTATAPGYLPLQQVHTTTSFFQHTRSQHRLLLLTTATSPSSHYQNTVKRRGCIARQVASPMSQHRGCCNFSLWACRSVNKLELYHKSRHGQRNHSNTNTARSNCLVLNNLKVSRHK